MREKCLNSGAIGYLGAASENKLVLIGIFLHFRSISPSIIVQLVGGGPHLGEQVVGVVQLGAGPAVLMGDGAPFWSQ